MDDSSNISFAGPPNPVFLILFGILWLLTWVLPIAAVLYAGYFFITLPLRRQERARFFLDLVETGLKDGRSLEQTVASASSSGDASMGMRFHLLAGYLEGGHSFETAIEHVPRLLPAGIVALLKAGIRAGKLDRVLPACRQLLKDALSQTCGAVNYVLVLAFVITPATLGVLAAAEVLILPKILDIYADMAEGLALPAILVFLLQYKMLVLLAQGSLLLVVWGAAFLYVGGPRLHSGLDFLFGRVSDWVLYALPWRRKRMQRDFSAALAILLDAGLPETDALGIAAECAANRAFLRRVDAAKAALSGGGKLVDAVALIDGTGEFRWRLSHATGARGSFFEAIAGWNESLDARAFQQEQAAAQLVTTGLVLLNGLFVGTIVYCVFGMIISIINEGVLW